MALGSENGNTCLSMRDTEGNMHGGCSVKIALLKHTSPDGLTNESVRTEPELLYVDKMPSTNIVGFFERAIPLQLSGKSYAIGVVAERFDAEDSETEQAIHFYEVYKNPNIIAANDEDKISIRHILKAPYRSDGEIAKISPVLTKTGNANLAFEFKTGSRKNITLYRWSKTDRQYKLSIK